MFLLFQFSHTFHQRWAHGSGSTGQPWPGCLVFLLLLFHIPTPLAEWPPPMCWSFPVLSLAQPLQSFHPALSVKDPVQSLRPDSHFLYTSFPDHPIRINSFLTQFYISIIILFKFNFHFFASWSFLLPLTISLRVESYCVGLCSL